MSVKKIDVIQTCSYPIYAVDVVSRNAVVVAGGGGAVKTGVPNRIDVVHMFATGKAIQQNPNCPINAKVGGGVNTGLEAVMQLTATSSGDGSFITSLEGRQCVEYLVRLKSPKRCLDSTKEVENEASGHLGEQRNESDGIVRRRGGAQKKNTKNSNVAKDTHHSPDTTEKSCSHQEPDDPRWEFIKLHRFVLPVVSVKSSEKTDSGTSSGMPTCIASEGKWLAVGSDVGSVFLINRMADSDMSDEMKPDLVYSDVSKGLTASVCSLSLSPTFSLGGDASKTGSPALLATICDRPGWTFMYVWRTNLQAPHKDEVATTPTKNPGNNDRLDCNINSRLYAMASCDQFSASVSSPPSATSNPDPTTTVRESSSERSAFRFKHCRFLRCPFKPSFASSKSGTQSFLLATTVQPLCANRKSHGLLVIWLVPFQGNADQTNEDSVSPSRLTKLADVSLPKGHMPACLAVHPSRSRGLIGVGSMDGRVDVYLFSPLKQCLTCVYSLDQAHPIFVTALTFLAPRPWSQLESRANKQPGYHQPYQGDEDSFELISVSVDRVLRWHRGPSYVRVSRLMRGLYDPDDETLCGRLFSLVILSLGGLFLIFLLPLLVSMSDSVLSRFI
ncbi:unnamed protein product [Calicophoron daubneyi]|uniref:Prolactin regulatory element-binding protein n=1 Tax=Calicophoron daubneyi TaxID=300641 RepID=A0AAV2TXM4_CALDB